MRKISFSSAVLALTAASIIQNTLIVNSITVQRFSYFSQHKTFADVGNNLLCLFVALSLLTLDQKSTWCPCSSNDAMS
jgi:hypothetical protein